MSKLTDYRLLSFDVYGTLIDWETGLMNALKPILTKNGKADLDKKTVMTACQRVENVQQKRTPDMLYSELLTTICPDLCAALGCDLPPTTDESKAFGDSVGTWPAFADTVDALRRLKKRYKLVVLSNVDNTSFSKSNAGPLEGFEFDAVLTAQDIGSYKPDHNNFQYMLKQAKERFGIEKAQVLKTAQSQFHDHQPCRQLGIKSAWIDRYGSFCGTVESPVYDWRFETLGEMADAVEKEARGSKQGIREY